MRRPRFRRGSSALLLAALSLALVGCAAGDPRFTPAEPAGFWIGLWHGVISWVTLVIGIFSDTVEVYEVHNTGGWYTFGFLLGIGAMWGGGSHGYHRRRRPHRDDREWEEIAKKVERKLERKLRTWAETDADEDWEVVGEQVQAKIKRKLREWADDDSHDATTPTAPRP